VPSPDAADAATESPVLGGGLRLRTATADDVGGIVAVETAAFGDPDGAGILGAIDEGGGPENWAVVVDDHDRVVSASALLDLTVEVDGCPVPSGQVEWVATYPEHASWGQGAGVEQLRRSQLRAAYGDH